MSAPRLKILVVDDLAANVAVVRAVAERLGHVVVTAADGREAVEAYQREQPDLVFMDVMMPEMDGLAAVREIRSLPAERWVPVVFLSAMDRMDDILRGLEGGGDDYLVKPVDLRLLRAKINACARAIALQRELFDYAEELARWQTRQRSENELARHVMARLTQAEARTDPLVQIYGRPADHFSGDLICVARTPADVLHILVADATGHGLAAALSAMPLPPVFYGMTAKGFSLAAIASELNRKLKRLLPADRFVAATLAAVDVSEQTIEVWNGGNPSA
ncbi:MAG: response regulator, partial [Thiobacillaceae bacterium]